MDTVRINQTMGHSSRTVPRTGNSSTSAASYFIGFFILFVFGLMVGVNILTAIGLVGYVLSFLYMREEVWKDIAKRKTLRRYFSGSGIFAE